MTTEEIIAEFDEQGLSMEPENDGRSIYVLNEVLQSLCDQPETLSKSDQ